MYMYLTFVQTYKTLIDTHSVQCTVVVGTRIDTHSVQCTVVVGTCIVSHTVLLYIVELKRVLLSNSHLVVSRLPFV